MTKINLIDQVFYCQAENPGRNCSLEAVGLEMKIGEKLGPKGVLVLLSAIMSLAGKVSIDRDAWLLITGPAIIKR